jgi:hypothetical protein
MLGPPGEVKMSILSDEIERRSRLVLLAYEVLRDMEAPAEEATSRAVFSALARAFLDKATAEANRETSSPRERRKSAMFSMP